MSIKDRGFASMDKDRRRRIARKGGILGHRMGKAHEWTSAEASAAGRKGGIAWNSVGYPASPAMPDPLGPRNRDQS